MRAATLNTDKQIGSYYDYWEQRTFKPADRKEEITSVMVSAFFNFPDKTSIYNSKLTNEGMFYDYINGNDDFEGQLTGILAKLAKGEYETARTELRAFVEFVFDLVADSYMDDEVLDDLDYIED